MKGPKQAPPATQSAWSMLNAQLSGQEVDWPKDDLLDVMHWIKMAIAVISGAVFGFIPIMGWHGFSLFLILYFSVLLVSLRILKIDEEQFGGLGDFINDNLAVGFGLFLLVWILVFNAVPHE